MLEVLTELTPFGLLVALAGIGLEAIKRTNVLQERFYPLASLLLGTILGFLVIPATSFTVEGAIVGFIAGATASGSYDFVKKSVLGK